MATYESIGQRRNSITELITQRGYISLSDLGTLLDISESTARRDLEALELNEVLTRTRGGAVCKQYSSAQRLELVDRETSMAEEKTAIARLAASMVADHQLVIINGGTTCYALASALAGRRMSVVTNALPVASLLSIDFQTEVTLIGGYLYPRTGVALGLNSRDQMSSIRADLLITGCGGISEDGIYNINQMMADMDSTMMKSADRVILLADSSKFGRGGLARVCDLNNVNTIITDRGLDKNWKKRFESSSTEVIIAD
jgi:DeoR/GlpR family transcriptional regulator of sugar metabolism